MKNKTKVVIRKPLPSAISAAECCNTSAAAPVDKRTRIELLQHISYLNERMNRRESDLTENAAMLAKQLDEVRRDRAESKDEAEGLRRELDNTRSAIVEYSLALAAVPKTEEEGRRLVNLQQRIAGTTVQFDRQFAKSMKPPVTMDMLREREYR